MRKAQKDRAEALGLHPVGVGGAFLWFGLGVA